MIGFFRRKDRGFSLAEIVAALTILAIITSGVVVVIQRCTTSAADLSLKTQAFEVARDNMEKLLSTEVAGEMIEYGASEKYPGINWEMVVETFREPLNSDMWVRAVSSAEYTDLQGEICKVELTNWLTDVSEKLQKKIVEQKQKDEEQVSVAMSLEEAAEYVGVDVETIKQWIRNGMHVTEDGGIPLTELDLYLVTDGRPTFEDRIAAKKEISPDNIKEKPSDEGKPSEGEDIQPEEPQKHGDSGDVPDFSEMTDEEIWQWVSENLK